MKDEHEEHAKKKVNNEQGQQVKRTQKEKNIEENEQEA